MIDKYSFGHIKVNGCDYLKDIIIFPDSSIKNSWQRKRRHKLIIDDIYDLIEAQPQVIILGTGFLSLMRPEKGLNEMLDFRGIDLHVASTKKAAYLFNEIWGQRKVGGCFHLGC